MYNYKYQRGMGAIGWLCVILIVVFFGTSAFKMVPAYNENQMIKTALRSLADGPDNVHEMPKSEIRSQLRKFYTINNVRGEAAKNLEIDRQRDQTLVKINYEVREKLFGNVSVVMTFNNVLDSSKPDACCKASASASE